MKKKKYKLYNLIYILKTLMKTHFKKQKFSKIFAAKNALPVWNIFKKIKILILIFNYVKNYIIVQ